MSDIIQESEGFIAKSRLWLTEDGKIVRDGDSRAFQLLAPEGGLIPPKLAARLGLDKGFKVEPSEKSGAKTISPEVIETRSTRPEKPASTR